MNGSYLGTEFSQDEIEKELNSISEIKEIRSNSIQGFSTIVAEFQSGTEIEYAKSKVNDAVDKFEFDTLLIDEAQDFSEKYWDFFKLLFTTSNP